jgi:hypothetical protein
MSKKKGKNKQILTSNKDEVRSYLNDKVSFSFEYLIKYKCEKDCEFTKLVFGKLKNLSAMTLGDFQHKYKGSIYSSGQYKYLYDYLKNNILDIGFTKIFEIKVNNCGRIFGYQIANYFSVIEIKSEHIKNDK